MSRDSLSSRRVVARAASPRAVIALLVLATLAAACGLSSNWPDEACSSDLAVGTVCVPDGSNRSLDLFADVSGDAAAADTAMSDPLAGALAAQCNAMPTVFHVCVSAENGITVVTPVVLPKNGRVSFTADDFDATKSVELQSPLGLRRDAGFLTVVIHDGDDKQVGSIPLGLYVS